MQGPDQRQIRQFPFYRKRLIRHASRSILKGWIWLLTTLINNLYSQYSFCGLFFALPSIISRCYALYVHLTCIWYVFVVHSMCIRCSFALESDQITLIPRFLSDCSKVKCLLTGPADQFFQILLLLRPGCI